MKKRTNNLLGLQKRIIMSHHNKLNESQTFRATFKIKGPITRSTFSREKPDSEVELLNNILHWSWSLRMQVDRLKDDMVSEIKDFADELRLKARKSFSRTSCDEQLLFVIAANLDRALNLVSSDEKNIIITKETRRALKLLRNIYEHWDELRNELREKIDNPRSSLGKLKREFPDAEPWSITIDPDTEDILLAKIVSVQKLIIELRMLEAQVLLKLRSLERKTDKTRLKT